MFLTFERSKAVTRKSKLNEINLENGAAHSPYHCMKVRTLHMGLKYNPKLDPLKDQLEETSGRIAEHTAEVTSIDSVQ